jgi:DNA polymerase-3 subunit gamma/tau
MARNKRLHLELALIKLCYLQQALQLTVNGGAIDKKKIIESSKPLAFKNITPIIAKPFTTSSKQNNLPRNTFHASYPR